MKFSLRSIQNSYLENTRLWQTQRVKRSIVLIFINLFILSSCANPDPIEQRYEDAAESSSNLTKSVTEYMMWMNNLSESIQKETNYEIEGAQGAHNSDDFNEKTIEDADTRVKEMKEHQGRASTFMDLYLREDSESATLVANFVEAIGPWILGQGEKWNVIRVCYERSSIETKGVLLSCVGSADYSDFEKWRDLDEQILQLANEVEGIKSS